MRHGKIPAPPGDRLSDGFAALAGAFFGLALLKFGNPAVLEKLVERPTNIWEWIFNGWPVAIGFWLLASLVVMGLFAARWKTNAPRWLVFLPLIWLGWQFIIATHTVDVELTCATLEHFAGCVICFYLGLFALAPGRRHTLFFAGLLVGLMTVIAIGWQQHFGGLEETRRYFFKEIYPQLKSIPPEYLKKISSNRIFSTLFYPNALAGTLLLLLPVALTLIWQKFTALTAAARGLLVGLVGIGAMGCLFWSGSKGGWLLMLTMGLVALLRLDLNRKWKFILVTTVLAVGMTGFALRYVGYFKKGATSATARGDYWRAAVRTAAANPVFGTGPGTFAIPYKQLKKPESEMARLVHNDYLQQASDSGIVGALAYTGFIAGMLVLTYRRLAARKDWLSFAVWLGLLGWSLQGLMEFSLYIPALAWTAFVMFGWLLGGRNEFDTRPENR